MCLESLYTCTCNPSTHETEKYQKKTFNRQEVAITKGKARRRLE